MRHVATLFCIIMAVVGKADEKTLRKLDIDYLRALRKAETRYCSRLMKLVESTKKSGDIACRAKLFDRVLILLDTFSVPPGSYSCTWSPGKRDVFTIKSSGLVLVGAEIFPMKLVSRTSLTATYSHRNTFYEFQKCSTMIFVSKFTRNAWPNNPCAVSVAVPLPSATPSKHQP